MATGESLSRLPEPQPDTDEVSEPPVINSPEIHLAQLGCVDANDPRFAAAVSDARWRAKARGISLRAAASGYSSLPSRNRASIASVSTPISYGLGTIARNPWLR